MKRVNLMVGGPQSLIPMDEVQKRRQEPWLATDHGAVVLLRAGIVPQMALGDFDSSTNDDFAKVKAAVSELQTFPPEKDYTDTQMGVMAAFQHFHPDRLTIFGATGGRLDHFLANLYLPLEPRFAQWREQIRYIDRQNVIDFFNPGKHELHQIPGMAYLAIVGLTPVKGLTLPDEKYTLDHYDSNRPISWASNEFLGPINHLSFDSGVVAVIQSKDSQSDLVTNPQTATPKQGTNGQYSSRHLNRHLHEKFSE